ncbi:hypothetical protein NDR89_22785 [Cupriavidus gilardii]|uniref:Uncharacterized protein n=1 Tax=Cupriavidus gilardii TaxID=82541 RepID=A0ABY4VQG6_9BURK|nr:hypothetical protein [Cupriavidus gilardii]USE79423.1 hypothetical protein NDR89_22785 [Cupriavidus gilardii]
MTASHIDFDMPLPPAAWHGGCHVQCGADGRLELGSSFAMALRAGLHRIFRIGKTSADAARNRASWRALIAAFESRGGAAVRERLCRASLALPGDRASGLTIADRIERGSYLSHAALLQVFQLFRCTLSVHRANQRLYAELLTPAANSATATPLYAMLDGISLGLGDTADSGAACPLPATRAYVAEQLKLGLQAQATRPRQRDRAVLLSTLASCAPELASPNNLAGRDRWLREYDRRLRTGPIQQAAMSPSERKACDREAAVAGLLADLKHGELVRDLKQNEADIAEKRSRLERESSDDADDMLAELLATRTGLLAALKERELHDVLRRCDGELALSPLSQDATHIRSLMQRRSHARAQLDGNLAVQKQRDLIRADLVKGLCLAVQQEVDRHTARGERMDESGLLRVVDAKLSAPACLRQFLAARNLQYLHDLGHGHDRAAAIAALVRASDRYPFDEATRGELDSSDFQWLSAALEAGESEAVALNHRPMLNGARKLFARFFRERWPIAAICDNVAALLDDFAEDHGHASYRRGCYPAIPLEARWQAGVHALHDRIRNAELGPSDVIGVMFPAIKSYLRARHEVMEQVRRDMLVAEARLDELRGLFPELSGWTASVPAGAMAATLLDLASVHITGRLMNAHNRRLEARRVQDFARQEGQLAVRAARRLDDSLQQWTSLRDQHRARMADHGIDEPDTDGAGREGPADWGNDGEGALANSLRQQWDLADRHASMALGDTANALENRLDAEIEQLRRQSAAQMGNVKRDIERALRDALEGSRSRPGMLETVCDVLDRASAKLPGWLASMNHDGELEANHATRRQALELREAAANALPLIDRIRREHVVPLDHTADLPDAAVAPYREDLQAVHRALDALAHSLQWVVSTIRIAGMETAASTRDIAKPAPFGPSHPIRLQVQCGKPSAGSKIVLDLYRGKLPPVLGWTVRQLVNMGALR